MLLPQTCNARKCFYFHNSSLNNVFIVVTVNGNHGNNYAMNYVLLTFVPTLFTEIIKLTAHLSPIAPRKRYSPAKNNNNVTVSSWCQGHVGLKIHLILLI